MVVTRKTFKAATIIQRCARRYMSKNVVGSLSNKDDSDPITLEPVRDIPQDRLFVLRMHGKRYGYDAFSWLQSIVRDRRHPSTRERLPMTAVHACYTTALKAHKNHPEDTPQPVKDAIDRMRMPVSLVHIEQRPAPKRKFAPPSRAAPARAFRWLVILRVSPLYTLTSIKVYGKMNTPTIEYGIEDSRQHHLFEASSSSMLAKSNQDNGLVALASDALMARDAARVMTDLEAGYVSVSELNGLEDEDEEEELEELEEDGNTTDGSWETTDDDSDFEP